MIKVLNRTVKQKVYKQLCGECRSELEFGAEDAYEGALGAMYIKCPVCGHELIVGELDGVNLNSNNIEFPKHFFKFNGVDIDDEEIQQWVRKCLKVAEESDAPYGYFVQTGSGNSRVILMAYEDEYNIVVAKNYYETSVSRE